MGNICQKKWIWYINRQNTYCVISKNIYFLQILIDPYISWLEENFVKQLLGIRMRYLYHKKPVP